MFGSQFGQRFGQRFGNWKTLYQPFNGPFGSFGGSYNLFRGLGNDRPHIYRRKGFLGRIGEHIPAPLKVFTAIAGMAAITVIAAPAIIILMGPPLICGAWLVHKRRKMLQSVFDQLHDQRWRDMASFHLQRSSDIDPKFQSNMPHKQLDTQQIPVFARITIENAVSRNEQNITTKLGIESLSSLSFGEISLLSQDFRLGSSGLTEQMVISEYPIYVRGHVHGLARIVSRGEPNKESQKSRIEVQTRNGSIIILNSSNLSDSIIEGHGHRVK